MKPIKAIDAAFLQLETDSTPMHVGALFVLEPRTAAEGRSFFRRFKSLIGRSLGRSEIFTRRVAALPLGIANPMWVTAGDVDLDYHVRRTVLPEPGTQHQLEACVADLHALRMDLTRPLWELHVIEGLQGGRLAVYTKTHHAGLDGASAQVFLMATFDAGKPARAGTRPRSPPPPGEDVSMRELLRAAARHQASQWLQLPARAAQLGGSAAGTTRRIRDAIVSLGDGARPTPRTPLNVAITGGRSFASLECDLAKVKAVAKSQDATVNDVVLAACSGALRRWLVLHDALPEHSLKTAVPVSTREDGNTDQSIQVTFMSVDLHTDLEDAHKRLEAIHASSLEAKDTAARMKTMMPQDLPSLGLPWLLGGIARLMSRPELIDRLPLPTNIIISNVAGPPVPLFVAGARVTTYTPVSIPYHGCALNVTVYSYDGRLFFGLTGARNALPDLRDLADGVRTEIELLSKSPRKRRPRNRR
jgi:WS/DGAT/MGAT family acyltransferase